MKAWVAERFGEPLEVLRLRDVEMPRLEAGHILVRVLTATINKNEVDGIRGIYASMPTAAPFVPGFEVYGIVEQAGAGAETWVGKHVIGMPRGGHGGYAEYAVLPAVMAFEVPASMPAATASAIFWPFHLAWLSLFTRARLQRGETVLIHAGAGGFGSAAIQLAVHAGARVIATAGSDDKLQLCRDLGAEVTINYRTQDFVKEVLDATGGQKVDVAVDSIGGDVLEQTWRCLNYGARHVILGFSSGIQQEDERPVLLRQLIFGNFSMVGVLMTYVDDKPLASADDVSSVAYPKVNFNMPGRALGEDIHRKLLDLLARGRIRPVVGLEVGFSELPSAIDRFDRREIAGRVVVHTTR